MDPFDPDDWTKLETAFTSAPRWAVMLATGGIVGAAVWWFRGWMLRERVDRLKEQIAAGKEQIAAVKEQVTVAEQQLKLATAAASASERALEELKKEFQVYKVQVAAKGKDASPAKVDAAIVKVADSNTNIGDRLVELYRDLDGFGAYRKLDPETFEKIKDIGKPMGIPGYVKKRD
jgi:predicted  nucleic acid-binding Zn-ribbon protein